MLCLAQVQKDALQKDYSNIKYEQPYQTAMYNQSLLFEAKRWHVHSYEEALVDLHPQHLTVMHNTCTLTPSITRTHDFVSITCTAMKKP